MAQKSHSQIFSVAQNQNGLWFVWAEAGWSDGRALEERLVGDRLMRMALCTRGGLLMAVKSKSPSQGACVSWVEGQGGWTQLPFTLSPQASIALHLRVCVCLTPKNSRGSSSFPQGSWATVTSEDMPGHLSLNNFSLCPKHKGKVWWSVFGQSVLTRISAPDQPACLARANPDPPSGISHDPSPCLLPPPKLLSFFQLSSSTPSNPCQSLLYT